MVLSRLWTLSVDDVQPTLWPYKGWEHTKYSEVFSENVILNLSTILQTRGTSTHIGGQNCTEGPVWTRATPSVQVSVSVRCQVVMGDFKFVVASICEEWLAFAVEKFVEYRIRFEARRRLFCPTARSIRLTVNWWNYCFEGALTGNWLKPLGYRYQNYTNQMQWKRKTWQQFVRAVLYRCFNGYGGVMHTPIHKDSYKNKLLLLLLVLLLSAWRHHTI